MTNRKNALTQKVFVLGVDGLDPRYSNKMLREGKMPNLQKFIDRGSCREDLVLLGGHPTVTPPMWTTLACGCYANVHGITAFNRQGSDLDKQTFNFDSRNCAAEPMWDVLVENGIKTAIVHWPGNSWPPTKDSEYLMVCDGSTPGGLGMSAANLGQEFCAVADVKIPNVTFAPSATADLDKACVIDPEMFEKNNDGKDMMAGMRDLQGIEFSPFITNYSEGQAGQQTDDRLSLALSPVKEANGWAVEVPDDAKEFTLLLSKGFIRRPGLILKNENGEYDRVALYKNKKEAEPFVVLLEGVMTGQIYDQAVVRDEHKDANYSMKLLKCAKDGTHVEIYISTAMDMHADYIFYPSSLFYEIAENVGYISPCSVVGNHDPKIVLDCMMDCWNLTVDWQADLIHYLIEQKGAQAVFSHMHNIDLQEHRFIRYMVDTAGYEQGDPEMYRNFMDELYMQTDRYLGRFLHLLDEGWSIIITSDHAQVCPAHKPPLIGDTGINVIVMEELGYTAMQRDENGEFIRSQWGQPQIDWYNTKAVASRECNIYLNIKGRNKHTLPDGTVVDGIVDPADQYELEEQLMTDLYGYKDPVTGKRVIALALRNKDAVLLGYGGPECGDICYWVSEGYNIDHADGLSTAYGECETSLSPIFVAAGRGFKEGFKTDRWIRQVDVAPTIATLMNVRMPAQCEGAPVYQIFDVEF